MGLRTFPHSRQLLLCRGVIRPQNGHILCDGTSRICGVSVVSSFPNRSPRNASRLRRRRRYGRRTGSIGPCFLPLLGNCLPRDKRSESSRTPHIRKRRPTHDDRLPQTILCRIAHISPGASYVYGTKMPLSRSATEPALTESPYETRVVCERSSLPLRQIF